jgi:poly(A) polymerase
MNPDTLTTENPWPDTPQVKLGHEIIRRLQEAGHEAWFVGGSVRNWLLRQPVKDVDIATSATPDEVSGLFEDCRYIGAHFGVTIVVLQGIQLEVATFRSEGSYVDRRRPEEVRYGTREEDFQRRDFTMNAMYYDPSNGVFYDPAGGLEDLMAGLLKTVGEPGRRFSEDALRLMRAVRFTARYGFELEGKTRDAIRGHAQLLAEISVERVADELTLILAGPNPGRAMHLMSELGIWDIIMPEVELLHGCEQPPEFHPEGDVFVHTAMVLDALRDAWRDDPPAELALAALLHDIGKPGTLVKTDRVRFPKHHAVGAEAAAGICRCLKLSSQVIERVEELVHGHMQFMDVRRMKRSRLLRFLDREIFDQHLALHRADCRASHGMLDNYEFCQQQLAELKEAKEHEALLPPPLIDGNDLIAAGYRPGPLFSEILEAVRDEQLEKTLGSREETLDWVSRQYQPDS